MLRNSFYQTARSVQASAYRQTDDLFAVTSCDSFLTHLLHDHFLCVNVHILSAKNVLSCNVMKLVYTHVLSSQKCSDLK